MSKLLVVIGLIGRQVRDISSRRVNLELTHRDVRSQKSIPKKQAGRLEESPAIQPKPKFGRIRR
jgi:hypothetical protein